MKNCLNPPKNQGECRESESIYGKLRRILNEQTDTNQLLKLDEIMEMVGYVVPFAFLILAVVYPFYEKLLAAVSVIILLGLGTSYKYAKIKEAVDLRILIITTFIYSIIVSSATIALFSISVFVVIILIILIVLGVIITKIASKKIWKYICSNKYHREDALKSLEGYVFRFSLVGFGFGSLLPYTIFIVIRILLGQLYVPGVATFPITQLAQLYFIVLVATIILLRDSAKKTLKKLERAGM